MMVGELWTRSFWLILVTFSISRQLIRNHSPVAAAASAGAAAVSAQQRDWGSTGTRYAEEASDTDTLLVVYQNVVEKCQLIEDWLVMEGF